MKFDNLDVVIPTCNRAKFLKATLTALFRSSCRWRKTIILDNASTDDTEGVLDEMRKRCPDRELVVFRHSQNVGVIGNFIKTQDYSENEYVAVFHDDDIVHPEYIEYAMSAITKEHAVCAFSNIIPMLNCDDANWPTYTPKYCVYSPDNCVCMQLLLYRFNFCTAIYRTEFYKKVQYRPSEYGKATDIVLVSEVAKFGKSVVMIDIGMRYRQHLNSDSNRLDTGPFVDEVGNVLQRLNELDRNSGNIWCRLLMPSLIYEFAFFLYCWSGFSRFCEFSEFRDEQLTKIIHSRTFWRIFSAAWPIVHKILRLLRKCLFRIKSKTLYYKIGFGRTY